VFNYSLRIASGCQSEFGTRTSSLETGLGCRFLPGLNVPARAAFFDANTYSPHLAWMILSVVLVLTKAHDWHRPLNHSSLTPIDRCEWRKRTRGPEVRGGELPGLGGSSVHLISNPT
jgi:hypothetical protein